MANKKAKKMTAKEFKRVFSEYYGNFDVWGYDGILNLICLAVTYKLEQHQKCNPELKNLIDMEYETRDKIWKYLKDNGYWNN